MARSARKRICIRFRTFTIIWLPTFSSMHTRYSGLLIDNCASLQEITVACWLSSTWNAAWAFTWCSPTFRQFWLSSFPGCPFGWMLIRWPDGQPWAWLLCWRFPAKHQVHRTLSKRDSRKMMRLTYNWFLNGSTTPFSFLQTCRRKFPWCPTLK